MQYRHELKYNINYSDYLILKSRLKSILKIDKNADKNGEYVIRSLYFDNIYDKAFREKVDGVNNREKYRIRIYNNDYSCIRLEKKTKRNNFSNKKFTNLTYEQTRQIIDGDPGWMSKSENQLILELYSKIKSQILKPKTVVEYTREAFIFLPGNVRVTLDRNIKTGYLKTDLLDSEIPLVNAGLNNIILEVKYDNFIPEIIKKIINTGGRRSEAISKYGASRIYG